MLSADQAVTICRKHGLSLNDAVSLRLLADDEESAEVVAARFTQSDATTAAQELFGVDDRPALTMPDTDDDEGHGDDRQVARDLFR